MSLDTIKNLAEESGNEELITAVSKLENTFTENVSRIGSLEKDLQKAIEKRDRQAQLVKSTFGIDEISEKALNSLVDKTANPDDTLKAENDKLASMIEAIKSEKDSVLNEYKSMQNKYKIEKTLTSLGAVSEVANTKAYDILLGEVSKGLAFDDNGNPIFKADDGTTVRNSDGSPLTLADKYEQLKTSDEFKFLFKASKSKSGSGANQGANSSSHKQANVVGSKEERLAYIKQKYNL